MGIARRYIHRIHRETGFYAAWTPAQPLALGDYGPLDDNGAFQRVGNVGDLGFGPLTALTEPRPNDFLDVTTGSGTSVTIKAAGQVLAGSSLPQASAGLRISITAADALVCKLSGPRQETLKAMAALQAFVVQAYRDGRWTKDWRIVTQRVVADGATIVYSDSDTVEVEATANAEITDIANPSLGFVVVAKKGGSVSVVGAPGLTPFVSLVRLRNPVFGAPELRAFTPAMVGDGLVQPMLMLEVPL
ncbi:MAG: hypothetical protein ABMA64_39015 [Myxococcota bacterium]